jgi:hypothetical protein
MTGYEMVCLSNESMLMELSQQGLDGGGAENARMLAQASRGQIAEINKTAGEINKIADATGKKLADQFYGNGIRAAQGIVDGLESKQAAIEKQMKKIAKAMIKAVKDELKIKSPSRVFMELAKMTMDGWAGGLVDGAKDVVDAVRDTARDIIDAASSPLTMAAMQFEPTVTPSVYRPALGVSGGSGGTIGALASGKTIHIEQNIHTQEVSYAQSKRGALDAARAAVRF